MWTCVITLQYKSVSEPSAYADHASISAIHSTMRCSISSSTTCMKYTSPNSLSLTFAAVVTLIKPSPRYRGGMFGGHDARTEPCRSSPWAVHVFLHWARLLHHESWILTAERGVSALPWCSPENIPWIQERCSQNYNSAPSQQQSNTLQAKRPTCIPFDQRSPCQACQQCHPSCHRLWLVFAKYLPPNFFIPFSMLLHNSWLDWITNARQLQFTPSPQTLRAQKNARRRPTTMMRNLLRTTKIRVHHP